MSEPESGRVERPADRRRGAGVLVSAIPKRHRTIVPLRQLAGAGDCLIPRHQFLRRSFEQLFTCVRSLATPGKRVSRYRSGHSESIDLLHNGGLILLPHRENTVSGEGLY